MGGGFPSMSCPIPRHQNRPHGFWVALLLIELISVTPGGQAQGAPDLAIEDLEVAQFFTVDANNAIAVVVRNNGQGTNVATITLTHRDCGGGTGEATIARDNPQTLDPGQVVRRSFSWSGRQAGDSPGTPAGTPLPGTCEIRASLSTLVEEGNRTAHERVQNTFVRLFKPQLQFSAPQNARPGEHATQPFTVRNLGNADDQVRLSVTQGTPGWSFTFSTTEVDLPRGGAPAEMILRARVPDTAARGDQGTATVQAASKNQATATDSVASNPFTTLLRIELRINIAPTAPPILPGARRTTPFSVENLGNEEETFGLSAEDPTGVLAASTPPQVKVRPNERVETGLVLEAPANAPAGPVDVWVRAVALTEPANYVEARHTVSVQQVRKVGLQREPGAPSPVDAPPGEDVAVIVLVRNEGNGQDDVQLGPVAYPTGWPLSVNPATHVLNQSETRPSTVLVRVPDAQPPGDHTIRMTAAPSGNPARQVSLDIPLRVPVLVNAELEAPADPQVFPPAGPASFSIRIRNIGNVDDRFVLTTEFDDAETAPAGWTATLNRTSATLAAGAHAPFQVTVTPPPSANEQSRAALRVLLKAEANPQFQKTAEVLVVPSLANLVANGLPTHPLVVYEGAPLQLNGTIRNGGRRPTGAAFDAKLTLEEDATGTIVAATTLRIEGLPHTAPGNETTISLDFSTVGRAGRYRARLAADTAGTGGEILELTEVDNAVDVRVEIHDARIRVAAPPSTTLRPGETSLLHGQRAFRVANLGMFPEWIETTIFSPQNWTQNATTVFQVAAGQSRLVTVSVGVPPAPGAPFGLVFIDARIPNASVPKQRNATVIVVNDTNPPTVGGLHASAATAVIGEPVDFTVQASDAVGVRNVDLVLVDERGAVRVHAMQALLDPVGSWAARLHMDEVGAFRYHVRAVDNSTNANRAETRATAGNLTVHPGTAPNTRLVDPQGFAVLREGSTVTFHIVDAIPLQRIWYTTGLVNRTLPIGNPVRVTVEGWREGPAVVSIYATNAQGGTSRRDFSFSVDNTAPRILDVRFSTFANGTRAFVNVSLDGSDVEAVEATLRFPGRLPPTIVALAPNNATFWQARVNLTGFLPIGVTATATDQAGNVGRKHEDIIHAVSVPEGGAPGVGILAVLAAFGLAFLPGRHRGRPRSAPRPTALVLVVVVFAALLSGLPAGLAQACPSGSTIVIEADRVLAAPQRHSCANIRLAANITIANAGRLELVQSHVDVTGNRDLQIRVLAGGELLLLRETRIRWMGSDDASLRIIVEPGALLHARQSEIIGVDQVTLRSGAVRVEDATIVGRGATTVVVENVPATVQRSTIFGGSVGVSLTGPQARLTLDASAILDQTATALHMGDGSSAHLNDSHVSNSPNGALLFGGARLTGRLSLLDAQETSLQTFPAGARHPTIRWEGGTIEPPPIQLSDATVLERSALVAVRVTWSTPPPSQAAGEAVAAAHVEVRNATGGLQWAQTTDADGTTRPAFVHVETQLGSAHQHHGPFTVLVRHEHSGDAIETTIEEDHPGEEPLAVSLPFDDDRQAPHWPSASPLSTAPYSGNGRPLVQWTAATDPSTDATPNRAVAFYRVYRVSGTAPLALLGAVTDAAFTDNVLPNGRYWYHVQPVDRANNAGANSNVVETLVDRDVPTLVAGFNRTHALLPGNYSAPVIVQGASADEGSGLDRLRYLVNGQERTDPVTVDAPGVHSIVLLATDRAGNEARQTVVVTYDASPPRLTGRLTPSIPDGREGWYRTPPRLDASATDDGPARLHDIRFRWGTGPWTIHNPATPLSGSGVRDLHVAARDAAANEARISLPVKLDPEAPTVEAVVTPPDGSNGWHRSPPQLDCRAEDAASGLERSEYRTAHQDWREIEQPVTLTLLGSFQVICRGTDKAGNQRETPPVPVQVDAEDPIPPTLRLLPNPANPRQTLADWSEAPPHDATSGVWKLRLLRAYAGGGAETLADLDPTLLRAPIPAAPGDNTSYTLEVVDRAGRTARSSPVAQREASAPLAVSEDRQPLVVQDQIKLAPATPPGFTPVEAQFRLDGILIAAKADPPFELDLDTRALEDGAHRLEIQIVSTTGQVYQETRTLEVRNEYAARVKAGGALYAAAAAALAADIVAAIVGVRRWMRVN